MSDDDFWNKDKAHVIVENVDPVAVYINTDGNIVIRQKDGPYDGVDSIVVIPPENARSVAEAISAALEEATK